jgi:two-component system, cell cycle sensor histidine kinase and response regulator CckA
MDEKFAVSTKELIKEISALKSRVRELEQSEARHKQEREELLSSQQQLRLLIDAGPDFFFLKDLDLRYQLVNKANAEFFGREEADIIGRTDFELMPGGAAAGCRESDQLSIHEKRLVVAVEPVADRFYETYKFPVIVEGEIVGVAGIIRDTTDRKRAENELYESRQFLSDIIEHSGALICVKDRQGCYELVNRKWEEVTGLKRGDVIGRTDEELFPGPTGKQFRQNDLEVMEEGSAVEKEEILKGENGKRFFISIKFPVRDNKDAIKGICGMITEITIRKEMEEELAISRNRLSRAEIISHSGNWEYDIKSERVFASDGACRICGLQDNELSIPEAKGIVIPEYQDILDDALKGLVENNRPYDVEYRMKRPDTGELVDIHSVAEYDRQRRVVFGIIQDVTDHKLLESQLFQAQKLEAIGTLAGGIAHDFNNILMGIQGYASLMMLELNMNHPHYEWLKLIEEQIHGATNLTRQLLGFARGGRYEIRPVDMNEIVRDSSTMFGRTRKEITIHGKYEKGLRTVEVDRGQIEQVLLNLYVNAWHAMPAGGELYLETCNVVLDEGYASLHAVSPGDYVRVSVTDTGTGMKEETRKRIFDPFFTTKEMGRGTGLGLAMVYGIMKGHKGIVDVASEPGRGTTFTLFFPVTEKKVVKVTEGKPIAPDMLRGKETILIVDDEPAVLMVSKAMIESLGYAVYVRGGGQEAIAFFREMKNSIDLVILDMIMPEMSGSETFDRIRELDPSAKVILSSGYSLGTRAQQIMDRGCLGFMQKPFNVALISRKIRETLDK